MKINKRDVLFAIGFSLLLGTSAFGQEQSQTPAARLLQALQGNRLPLTMSDHPSGPGWEWLVQEARTARFTLIGEEHGVAETAQFSAALFSALRESGYSRMAVELSPPIAEDVEAAARQNGFQGARSPFTIWLRKLSSSSDVIKGSPKSERVLWGCDSEIFSDRYLISKLEPKVPRGARPAFMSLQDASTKAWAQWEQDRNPDNMFLLAGDPALASAVRAAWPKPDPESDAVLRTLEASLAIEAAERAGGAWPYMQERAKWTRSNLAALLQEDKGAKFPPRS